MSLIAAASMAPMLAQDASQQLGAWGVETIEKIRQDCYIKDKQLYSEEYIPNTDYQQPSFNWGVGVMLSALNAAARYDAKYLPWLEEYATASRIYWNDKGPVAGYDVLPGPKPVDRYYDDNAWMVMQLVESYELTKDSKYLVWAREALTYVLSGEDKTIGGGIYWHETEKGGKATCSTGPGAAACLAVYRHTKDQRLLVSAIRLYGWTKLTLQDTTDYLFWDAIAPDRKITKDKWSYNTALMIRTAADLFAITGNRRYMTDLVQMQSSSARRWLGESLKDEGRFAHLLMDSWLFQRRRAPVPNPNQDASDQTAFVAPLTFLHDKARNDKGFYGKRFDTPPPSDQLKFPMIDQASAARAYFSAALYFREKAGK